MSTLFCNVALPVPLRKTFTYAVPEGLRAAVQPGSRVLAPFRKQAMVGVVVELIESPPADTKVRELIRALDLVPALTPKLMELALWVASYYLAPIGEVFRSMLPPITELSAQRQIVLTNAGREAAESLSGGELTHGLTRLEVDLLAKLNEKKGILPVTAASKMSIDTATLQKLQRRGLIEIREIVKGRERKTQRVIAWKSAAPESTTEKSFHEKEERVRELLQTERGPLPLPQLLKLAQVTRSVVERMLRDGFLESWE